ncbi:2-keto-4-pentenoate hydratase [Reyranella soli]|uniref:Fumarylacetoacetate (FAA) hydrolase n=1 Tax=Reyranella soli TaxID=1230389 RepID=A0A512NJJ5_9HYPH|nr:fumarylacetoacetate hydrolase family protein [Reyranella soli]GEP59123.1 fumarylacetoacetate (FAA) hydrolase [Reyranella soli]
MTDARRDLARLLATLRRDSRQQSGLEPRLIPADKDTAYRIARMVEEELGVAVAGWKIAAAKEEMQKALRTDSPIYGRVFAPNVRPSPTSVEHARQCSPIPEVEYMARLGVDLPPRAKAYTIEEVTEAVASLHPGIELAECRFVHDAAFPPLPAILADGAGSGTLCYGAAIDDWRKRDIAGQEVVLSCNGVARRNGSAAAALDHPMVPLTWLANELSRTGIGLKAGQMISTGTLTGMLRPKAGETYVADFGPFGQVTASYT